MRKVQSSENNLVTLRPLLLYTREDKLPLGTMGSLITANTVTGLGYRGNLRDIDPQFSTARTVIDRSYGAAQVVPRDYYRPDLGQEVFGARLPQQIVHSLFTFFREHIAQTATDQPSFDPDSAFTTMLGPDAITWQEDTSNPNLTYAPGDRMLLGGVYKTVGDNQATLMTTTNPEAALFSTVEQSGDGERSSLAVAAPWDIAAACGSETLTLVGIPVGFSARGERPRLVETTS